MNDDVKAGGDGVVEEWFDVVDASDAVIGRKTRREVHATGLWHRAVHVWVFDATGRIFLQRRSMKKDLSPGLWDSSCSGHVDSGEDYDTAAIRELGEEIGVHVTAAPARWLRFEPSEDTGWEFVWLYRMRHDGPFVLNPDEIQYGEWLTPAGLEQKVQAHPEDYCPSFRLIWSRVAAELLKS